MCGLFTEEIDRAKYAGLEDSRVGVPKKIWSWIDNMSRVSKSERKQAHQLKSDGDGTMVGHGPSNWIRDEPISILHGQGVRGCVMCMHFLEIPTRLTKSN